MIWYDMTAKENKKDKDYTRKTRSPSEQAVGVANAKLITKGSKTWSIKRFDENVSKLFLGLNFPHHNLSILNIISQEVVSHFYMFDLTMKAGIFG